MVANTLLNRLQNNRLVLGVAQTYPAPGIIEAMCPGWDFVWIDGQHGEMTYDTILNSIRAAHVAGVETMVRVPGHEPATLGRYADLCPTAIMVPLVNTFKEAEAIVRAVRLPPLGCRSFGGRRAVDLYGLNFHQEHTLAVVAQIETVESMGNVQQIARTEGVDVLFFGGDDMKLSMGIAVATPTLASPRVLEAMKEMASAARAAGKVAACVTPDAAMMRKCVEMGYQMLVGGADVGFMVANSRQRLAALREVEKEASPAKR